MQSSIFSIFNDPWSFRNQSNMMIYYQCWKQLCFLLYF